MSIDHFIKGTGNLDWHLVTCKKRIKLVFPENVYQLRETPFDKLDSFGNTNANDQNLYKNMAKFDFE